MSPDFTVPDAVTAPVLAVDADGVVRGANAAFVSASAGTLDNVLAKPFAALCDASVPEAEASLRALSQALRNRTPLDGVKLVLRDGNGAAWPVSLSARPVGHATWLTLLDRRESLRADRLEDLLNMAQQFGRLGVFERDPRTMEGRWDSHMHRFWGLSVDDKAPNFSEAQAYVVPEDRAAMGERVPRFDEDRRQLLAPLSRARRRRRAAAPAFAVDGEQRRRRQARSRDRRRRGRHRDLAPGAKRARGQRATGAGAAVERHRCLAPGPGDQSPVLRRSGLAHPGHEAAARGLEPRRGARHDPPRRHTGGAAGDAARRQRHRAHRHGGALPPCRRPLARHPDAARHAARCRRQAHRVHRRGDGRHRSPARAAPAARPDAAAGAGSLSRRRGNLVVRRQHRHRGVERADVHVARRRPRAAGTEPRRLHAVHRTRVPQRHGAARATLRRGRPARGAIGDPDRAHRRHAARRLDARAHAQDRLGAAHARHDDRRDRATRCASGSARSARARRAGGARGGDGQLGTRHTHRPRDLGRADVAPARPRTARHRSAADPGAARAAASGRPGRDDARVRGFGQRAQARQRPVSRALARWQLALAGLAVDPDLRRRRQRSAAPWRQLGRHAGARGRAGAAGTCARAARKPRQVAVPGAHEPRVAHAAACSDRLRATVCSPIRRWRCAASRASSCSTSMPPASTCWRWSTTCSTCRASTPARSSSTRRW